MSELKAMTVLDIQQMGCYDNVFVYFKSEADKVIAELKEQVHDYAQGPYVMQARAEKELRRQKYKRCLANAEACMHKRWRTDEGFDYARSTRHMDKWLEISEQFKPNNSTDQ